MIKMSKFKNPKVQNVLAKFILTLKNEKPSDLYTTIEDKRNSVIK